MWVFTVECPHKGEHKLADRKDQRMAIIIKEKPELIKRKKEHACRLMANLMQQQVFPPKSKRKQVEGAPALSESVV